MTATEQSFTAILSIMLYQVVQTFKPVDELVLSIIIYLVEVIPLKPELAGGSLHSLILFFTTR